MNEARHHQRAKINKRVFGILLSYQAVFVYFGWLLCVKSAENCILKTKGRIFFCSFLPSNLTKLALLRKEKKKVGRTLANFHPSRFME